MTVEMTADVAAKLREKFPADRIGLKPTIYCKPCKDGSRFGKTCDNHSRKRCPKAPQGCGQNITEAHMHIAFVGHADVTDRLLSVDPGWQWEPVAWTDEGLPRFDSNGGLWIRLTVAGVTRIGYGGADGDHNEDGIKEAISDAIKTTAMRFGVALDLWRKGEDAAKESDATPPSAQQNGRPANGQQRPQQRADKAQAADSAQVKLAKDELRAKSERMRYNLDKVVERYKAQYGESLKDATDPNRIRAFTKLLDGMPQHELGVAGAVAS